MASMFRLSTAGKKRQEPFFEGLGIDVGENTSTDSDSISEGKTEDRRKTKDDHASPDSQIYGRTTELSACCLLNFPVFSPFICSGNGYKSSP